jgi:hypothetical protein
LTGREENVVSIVLDPRRDCDVIADGIGKGATENGRSATTHSRILHRHFEWRQHHFKISNFQILSISNLAGNSKNVFLKTCADADGSGEDATDGIEGRAPVSGGVHIRTEMLRPEFVKSQTAVGRRRHQIVAASTAGRRRRIRHDCSPHSAVSYFLKNFNFEKSISNQLKLK